MINSKLRLSQQYRLSIHFTNQVIRLLSSSSTTIKNHHQGALPGGFSKESLQQWATLHWSESIIDDSRSSRQRQRQIIQNQQQEVDTNKLPYVDLFSKRLSNESIEYLNRQKYPSNELLSCFFGSKYFTLERMLLSPFYFNQKKKTPLELRLNDQYLVWSIKVHSPLEIICTWELNDNVKGCTMIAYDPSLRKVYHGNCINSTINQSGLFRLLLLPAHEKYAQLLLNGMVEEIERSSTISTMK